MNIVVEWGNESKTILLMDFVQPWTSQDLIAAMEQAMTMMDSIDHEASTIVDMSRKLPMPPDLLTHFPKVAQYRHPRTKTNVIVAEGSSFAKTLTNVFSQLYVKLRVADTREEAYTLLGEQMPPAGGA